VGAFSPVAGGHFFGHGSIIFARTLFYNVIQNCELLEVREGTRRIRSVNSQGYAGTDDNIIQLHYTVKIFKCN
jgi:hypothetical protein